MRQQRIQGSHFANLLQASQANNLVVERRIDPCMSEVFAWRDIPRAHTKMMKNQHRPGNMAVLVQAKRPGLRTLEDAPAADYAVCMSEAPLKAPVGDDLMPVVLLPLCPAAPPPPHSFPASAPHAP